VVNIPGIAVVPNGAREIPPVGVLKLYRAEGWWPERTAEQVRAVLRAAPAVGPGTARISLVSGARCWPA
jgi:hypothetical protein